jgi:enterochelin esterase-like enzyme
VVDGVAVAVGGVNPVNSEMIHIVGTDVWYRTYKVRNDARFVYKLSENDSLQSFVDPNRQSNTVIDPLNPRVFPTRQSYVELPDAPSQEIALRSSDMPGKIEKVRFHSTTLNNDRDVWIYTPHDFHADGATYPLAVVLDGMPYTTWVPVPTILDNLIRQGKIPPVVAVMVGAVSRETEQSCSTAFGDFLANELVPWMRTNYRTTTDPRLTVVGGSSRGGLASTCAAYQHPTIFGKVLSQSGSYWWKPDDDPNTQWLTRQVASGPTLPLRFYMEVGEMEIPDQLDTNRRLRDVLRSKGYVVDYREFNGNHTYLDWRGTFGNGLTSLLGDGRTDAQR